MSIWKREKKIGLSEVSIALEDVLSSDIEAKEIG